MYKIAYIIAVAVMLTSCNTGTTENQKMPEPQAESDSSNTQAGDANEEWTEITTDEALIATALMAAPEESRDSCTVIGYNMDGEFVTLKEGYNQFICLADDPKQEGFSAACYHKSLEPFMARGRELKKEGKSFQEIFDIREIEAKSGKLDMGKPGSTLHIYYGAKALYNPQTYKVADAQYRYVVYMPWATSESTGLPETPIAPNHPWIMNPGTHRAHIMITPINEGTE
tara:strand:+ start:187 stop:870 length:684 start_codon:yes stop_codon:yes gene_type:complete